MGCDGFSLRAHGVNEATGDAESDAIGDETVANDSRASVRAIVKAPMRQWRENDTTAAKAKSRRTRQRRRRSRSRERARDAARPDAGHAVPVAAAPRTCAQEVLLKNPRSCDCGGVDGAAALVGPCTASEHDGARTPPTTQDEDEIARCESMVP